MDIALLAPAQDGSHPLVIYLPGLGESCEAGAAWRRAWAGAGYAVLCAQPRAYGAAVWSSQRARTGDFFDIARDAFATPALAQRVALAHGVLDELRRRQTADAKSPYAAIDVDRIVIAGFDLGAQTALAVIRERVPGLAGRPVLPGVKGVIVLSPYPTPATGWVAPGVRPVQLPVLAVTSDQDVDPFGLTKTAAVRRAVFTPMPPGRKFLLVLSGAPHALLAGSDQPQDNAALWASRGGDSRAAGQGDDRADNRPTRRRTARQALADLPAERTPDQLWAVQLANVTAVTTAYLDAVVQGDPAAEVWLTQRAWSWLGDDAEWEVK